MHIMHLFPSDRPPSILFAKKFRIHDSFIAASPQKMRGTLSWWPGVSISSTSLKGARLRWAKSGVFDRIFRLLASDADNEYMMIDATIVRAHQHSAGAQKKAVTKRLADRAAD